MKLTNVENKYRLLINHNSVENFSHKPIEAAVSVIPKTNDEKPSVVKDDSIEKALSELCLAEEELTAKPKIDIESKQGVNMNLSDSSVPSAVINTASVPPSSSNIENFYKEVQRYEKIVNGLTTKTLNGTTPIEIKWKELNDLLEKDAAKRTVSISKLFPEKNRNMLSVPYDHSRVLLPTETDNYINAAHVRVGFNHQIFYLISSLDCCAV